MKVVVSTCDEYRWIIPIFMYFYKKYWPDNPYETEIITEKKHIDGKVFYSGGVSWSSGVRNYLYQSEEERFLLILEDLIIMEEINTKRVRIAEKLCEQKTGTVRLNNAPNGYFNKHSVKTSVPGFREYPLKHRFVMGLQPAIFQKDYLLDALRRKEDAWVAEQNGAKRLRKLKHKWQSIWPEENIFTVQPVGLMKKGKLKPVVLRWAKAELKADATKESMEIYDILQDQIKRQSN